MELQPFRTELRDGTPVDIREVGPADRELLRLGFDHLSLSSRYFRFLAAVRRLSERQLSLFTEANTADHMAIGALALGNDPAGIARYVRLPDPADAAEFALTVVDRHQSKGLGTLLLGVLAKCARAHGIGQFIGLVHRDNDAMLHILSELGGRRSPEGRSQWHVTVDLPQDPEEYPATPPGDAMRRAHRLATFR